MIKIKQFRKKQGLTQQELANKLGITSVYLCNLETGKRTPSFAMLNRIAKALNIHTKQLL